MPICHHWSPKQLFIGGLFLINQIRNLPISCRQQPLTNLKHQVLISYWDKIVKKLCKRKGKSLSAKKCRTTKKQYLLTNERKFIYLAPPHFELRALF